MNNLYNNGYIIKGLIKDAYASLLLDYFGVESFASWSLKDFDDIKSEQLEAERAEQLDINNILGTVLPMNTCFDIPPIVQI